MKSKLPFLLMFVIVSKLVTNSVDSIFNITRENSHHFLFLSKVLSSNIQNYLPTNLQNYIIHPLLQTQILMEEGANLDQHSKNDLRHLNIVKNLLLVLCVVYSMSHPPPPHHLQLYTHLGTSEI